MNPRLLWLFFRRSAAGLSPRNWKLSWPARFVYGSILLVILLFVLSRFLWREQPTPPTPGPTQTYSPTIPSNSGIGTPPNQQEEQPQTAIEEMPPRTVQPHIVGGERAAPGSWPWMVSIQIFIPPYYSYFCGGSLIAPEWVLTAAHCLANSSLDQIMAIIGPYPLTSNRGRQLFIDRIVIHPQYGYDFSHDFNHDIALLHLSRPVRAVPVALLTPANRAQEDANTLATVIGWGALSAEGAISNELRQVQVPVVSNDVCKNSYHLTDNMMCAGYTEGGKDACQGDSGGPLVVPDGQDGWLQVGIVSFGRGCALPHYYGVYTRVSQYCTWLSQYINGLECETIETIYLPLIGQ